MARHTAEGWLAFTAWDWTDAATFIEDYLRGRIRFDFGRLTPTRHYLDVLSPGDRPLPGLRIYGDAKDLEIDRIP
jgi:hypothetical protein